MEKRWRVTVQPNIGSNWQAGSYKSKPGKNILELAVTEYIALNPSQKGKEFKIAVTKYYEVKHGG